MPEDTIVSDEGATNGLWVYAMTEGAAAHDWMTLTGSVDIDQAVRAYVVAHRYGVNFQRRLPYNFHQEGLMAFTDLVV